MRLFCKWTNLQARIQRGQAARNDGIDRTRTAIVRPAAPGRTAVCHFGERDCRARGPQPRFSFSTPNTEIVRRDPATWPDRSGLRRFGNAAGETLDVSPFLPDCRS